MTTVDTAYLLAILVIGFALRLTPSLKNGYFGSDAFYHLMVARKARELHHLPEKDPGLVPEMTRVYPPLLQALLYPFKGKAERAALVAFSPLVDVVAMVVLYYLALELDVTEPLWPVILYAVSPLNIVDAASLNARPIANLAIMLSLGSAFIFWDEGSLIFLGLAAVFGAVVMLVNKMALQVWSPCMLAVAFGASTDDLSRGLLLLSVIPLALALAGLATLGSYLRRTLPDHIRFIRVHMKHGDYTSGRSELPSPIMLVKSNPLSVLGPILGIVWFLGVDSGNGLLFLVMWSIPVLLLAQLWIWGDSWRYLQFGTAPSALIIALVFTGKDVDSTTGFALLSLITVLLVIASVMQLRRVIRADSAAKLIAAMRSIPQDWKTKLNDSTVYSNMVHYCIPFELGVRMFSGNPSSDGMELYFQIKAKNTASLKTISDTVSQVLGKPLGYYLLFKGFKEPARDGFKVLFENDRIAILAK